MTSPHPESTVGGHAGTAARDTSRFGALVRGHRQRIGLTQRELADLSTISMRAIRNLEQGRATRPRPETVRLIADALRLGDRARTALESAAQQRDFDRIAPADLGTEAPAPPTALHPAVGREPETRVLADELSSGAERLVNVVGLGGVGKTRLALEVAGRLHADGTPVLWYAFPGTTPDYLPSCEAELATVLHDGVTGLYGGPAGRTAALAELVAERPVLLVLDGAPDRPLADRLTQLLRECPGLRLLVTGERPWDVPGERTFLLGPLEVPAADGDAESASAAQHLGEVAAVRVFLSHVRRVRPQFVATPADLAQVAEICRRLDGHPMALGSAASWLMVYDLGTLRECAGDDPVALLDHLAGGDGGRSFRQALHRRLHRMPRGHQALMADVCAAPDGEFGLADVVRLTGRPAAECGRMVRDLLLAGAIRPFHRGGRSLFQVLHLVRAVRTAESITAAAAAG
ncbi:helix-turn-helix domain-containing protein [Streptomyces sp. SL13]|uniref:Helix-turn-helix domain-containing protein n=1 Tax=Streptantibioticus silvisoli TaxID=2705255 RepID=A0AA90K6I5_9ACTN|nr:helix-turn-helix domain-containing protein [Streptantibioticus silvisoli]MDI5967753.1 helix-turn-helix domain-containing protein [Streptantibioticus silvisoli]